MKKELKKLIYSRHIWKLFIAVIIVFAFFTSAQAADSVEYIEVKTIPLYDVFKTKEKWHVSAYQAKEKDLELTELPAKLCFWRDATKNEQICYDAQATLDKDLLKFQFVDELSIIQLFKRKEPTHGILFISKFSGGGSGWLYRVTIWNYNVKENKFVNLLPTICISNQAEYKIMFFGDKATEMFFVTADYIAGYNETHFAPHKYEIKIYQHKKNKGFEFAGKYTTKSKYKSLDDVDKIDVIEPETKNIQEYILFQKRK